MEVDPNLAWDDMWKKVSHISYPPTVFQSCTRVPHSKGQFVDETVLEICSEDELDSQFAGSLNPPLIYSKDGNATGLSGKQPSAATYSEHTADFDVNHFKRADNVEDDRYKVIKTDLLSTSADDNRAKQKDIHPALSPPCADYINLEETSDNIHPGNNRSEIIAATSTPPIAESQHTPVQKGKWFRHGAQRRTKALAQAEGYVACLLCKRLFWGTRARNIHTNKAHSVVSCKRKLNMMPNRDTLVTGVEGNTVEELPESDSTTPARCESYSPSIEKRTDRPILEPSDTHDPKKEKRCEEVSGASESPHFASAYTVSSTLNESYPMESTKKRYQRKCSSSTSSSQQFSVSSSSTLCIENICTLSSPDQDPSSVDQVFIDNRSRNNQDKAATSTTTENDLCVTNEKTVTDADSLDRSIKLGTNGQIHVGDSSERLPSAVSGGIKQKPRQSIKSSVDATVRTDDGSYQCRICDRLYTNRFSLTGHYKSHYDTLHKPFSCDECSQRFTSQSNLNYHRLRNCPVLRVKALKNGTLSQESLPRNTSLLLAKAKRAIARKTEILTESPPYLTAVDTGRNYKMVPLPNALSTVRRVAPKYTRRKRTAVNKQSSDHVDKPLCNNTPRSPSAVLSTRQTPHAADKKQVDTILRTSCTPDSHCQQSCQQQVGSPSYTPHNQPTLTETLLPSVERIIDQAYDSQELRNKIVTLTSAAIISLISQALPQTSECLEVAQTPHQTSALSPNVSANHVLQVMTDMLRNQRVAQYSNSRLPGSDVTATQALDKLRRIELPNTAFFGGSPLPTNSCFNDLLHSPSSSEMPMRNAADQRFRQAVSSSSSPHSSMQPPFSPMIQACGLPNSTKAISPPGTTLLFEHGVGPVNTGNNAEQVMDRQAVCLVQSKTCPKCDRTFVSLSACRSHHTKVHVRNRREEQSANESVHK